MTYTLFVNDYRLTADTKSELTELLVTVFNLSELTIAALFNGTIIQAKDGKQYEIVAWNN